MKNTQTPTEIDPKLLQSLGKVMPAVPPERAPHDKHNSGSFVKPLNPPIVHVFSIDLAVPTNK